MKKVIVTGGAGYIGSHTIVELIKNGYTPIVIDNLCNTSISNIKGAQSIVGQKIKFYNVDCTDIKKLNEVFNKEKDIIGVIHFAAFKAVDESVREPEKYHKNNIGSLKALLETMTKHNVDNIIFSSSCTVYGSPDSLPVTENAPFKKAESPYGETKQLCEQILKKSSFNSISLRYFNPIGSHKSSLIGDCSKDKANNLIPILTETAIGVRKQMIVFGNDYKTIDGSCVRDYIHIEDLASAHVKAIDYLLTHKGIHAFNIGTGEGKSVLETIKTFERVNNIKINYKIGPRRDGDVEIIYSDNTLCSDLLKWKAEKSFEDGLSSAWSWQLKKSKK